MDDSQPEVPVVTPEQQAAAWAANQAQLTDYYAPLKTKWATLSGTIEEKLSNINSLTVNLSTVQPVTVGDVMAYLRTNNLWLAIKASNNQFAQEFSDINGDVRVKSIDFSADDIKAILSGLLAANLLQQKDIDSLNAMSAMTAPWSTAPVENGGAGLASPVGGNDLAAAGLS